MRTKCNYKPNCCFCVQCQQNLKKNKESCNEQTFHAGFVIKYVQVCPRAPFRVHVNADQLLQLGENVVGPGKERITKAQRKQ